MSINTKAIKNRINSVKNTNKVTRSMEKISAVKRAKFSTLSLDSAKYTEQLVYTNNIFANSLKIDENSPVVLQKRSLDTTMLIVLSSDRGLCGSFNSNIINATSKYIDDMRRRDPNRIIKMVSLGKKGARVATMKDVELTAIYEKLYESDSMERCTEISRDLVAKYLADDCDELILIHTKFQSAQVQNIEIERILPFKEPQTDEDLVEDVKDGDIDHVEGKFILEPSVEGLQEYIFLKTVDTKIYQAVLDSSASEHSSRMIAMKNASDNASDLSSALTLTFNKGRQASITQEVSEIVSGIEALSNLS